MRRAETMRTRHEQDRIYAEHPVFLEHLARLVEEDLGLVRRGVAARERLGLRAKEHLALREEHAQDGGEGRDASCAPEERTPCLSRLGNEVEIDDCGDEIADGVALLEDARRETTGFDGQVFERRGRSKAPDTTHGYAEERADSEELLECLDEAGTQLDEGDDEEVGDEGPFATVTVRDDTEDDL